MAWLRVELNITTQCFPCSTSSGLGSEGACSRRPMLETEDSSDQCRPKAESTLAPAPFTMFVMFHWKVQVRLWNFLRKRGQITDISQHCLSTITGDICR